MSLDSLNFLKWFLFSLLTTLSVGTTALAATPDNQYESVEMVAYPIFMMPESSLAVELQDQQVQAAAYLFDRDLNTAYSSIYPAQIVAPFGDLQMFNSLRIYGAAPFLLNIQAKHNDTWVPVNGLEGINLSAQPEQWNSFTATEAVSTTELLLNIAPLVGSASGGLREIEFWVQPPKESNATTEVAALPASSASPPQSDVSVKETHKVAKAATVAPGLVKKISHEEAELEVNGTAVDKETTVSVETLDTDLPALDTGMINVTKGPRKGYRFGPHGMKFKSKIKVKLPYDKSLLPEGYTEQEIKTYYYDEELGHWQPLERENVDTQGQAVTSLTDHFTDMINSVVTTPEAPDTVSYNPNQIKDIKAADPGTGVTLIEPPQANNMGSAGLSYPLEVPPGRVGMQPQLAVQYNSAGGNGWMGLGWDVGMQTVTIDTRWGVPRYDAGLETETYTLSGQQLTPLAHRGDLQPRTAEKVFLPRVEGSFAKIIRHGNSPTNYWWEVTDKNGTVSSYGGEGATLTDDNGNVFVWALREVRDTHGNTMQYRYEVVTDVGLPGGMVPGRELYLKTIHYTGYQGETGPYQVKFIRDRELGLTPRADVSIDARGGFKRVTADLLRKVEVTYNGAMVRSYEFKYQPGAFYKMLLKSITQYGEDGSVFNSHSFDYYDDIRDATGSYKGFATPKKWDTGDDHLAEGLRIQGNPSALGGSISEDISSHLYLGINPTVARKKGSVGLKVGYNLSNSKGIVSLIDINGDGLPDKVYKDGDMVFYRANQSGPGGSTQFGPPHPIATLPDLSKEVSHLFSVGPEFYMGVTGGLNLSLSYTRQSIYFSDVNGDGLPDLVKKKKVLFNHLDSNGDPYFTDDSADTPYPIGSGAAVDTTGLAEENSAAFQEQQDNFPLLDTIRRWVAPYEGSVRISGTVALLEDTSPDRQDYETADGVRVAVQHNDNELWATGIAATDYSVKTPTGLDAINVKKGDVLYFRVQSVFDGAYDQVSWQPDIQYLNVSPTVDANQLDVYHYNAAKDFTLAGFRNMFMTMPMVGKVRVVGELQKEPTSDDVTLVLLKNDQPVYSEKLAWNQTGSIVLAQDIEVAAQDRLAVQLQIDSPIDFTKLQWKDSNPLKLFYVSSPEQATLTDEQGQPTIQMNLFCNYDVYSESNLAQPLAPWVVPQTGVYTVNTLLALVPETDVLTLAYMAETKKKPSGTVVATAKRKGELLGKYAVKIVEGVVMNGNFPITATEGDPIYVEFSTSDYQLVPLLSQIAAGVTAPDGKDYSVPVELHSATPTQMVAQAYRGWNVFAYDGNRERAATPIVITADDLSGKALTEGLPTEADKFNDPEEQQAIADQLTKKKSKVLPFTPEFAKLRWKGPDDDTWAQADKVSSSRHGPDYIGVDSSSAAKIVEPTKWPFGILIGKSTKAEAIIRQSGSLQRGANLGLGPLSAGFSKSDSASWLDYMDVNGDRFPDVLRKGKVQFTDMFGGLEGSSRDVGLPFFLRQSHTESLNLGTGGSFPQSKDAAKGSNVKGTKSQMAPLGINGGFNTGDSESKYDLMDINGDGLPDLVMQPRDQGDFIKGMLLIPDINQRPFPIPPPLMVALNLGYGFAPPEPWGEAFIDKGASHGINMGIGFNTEDYSFAGGVTLTCSVAEAAQGLIDVNGDGLLDQVKIEEGGSLIDKIITGKCGIDLANDLALDTTELGVVSRLTGDKVESFLDDLTNLPLTDKFIRVNLNTGNGFAPQEIVWPTRVASGIGLNTTRGAGGGLYFTFGFPILPPPATINLVFNLGGDFGKNINHPEISISDIDGDGNPDYLYSTKDSELVVGRSLVERTNLLKTVKRPLGASFTVHYQRQGNTYNQPSSSWVMSAVEVNDGHPGDGVDKLVTTYRYENGFYHRQERDFYGYQTVMTETRDSSQANQLYRSVMQVYHNDSYYNKGLLKRELVTDGEGKKYQNTKNTYVLRDLATGQPLVNPNDLAATVFPALVQVDKRFFEGQVTPGKTTYETYEYDSLGNVIHFFDAGDVGAADDVDAVIGYFSSPFKYIVKPNSIVVTSNGVVMRKREATFDANTGEVQEVRQYLADGTAAVAKVNYDSYGNLTQMMGPTNYRGQRYALRYTYDDQVHTYNVSAKDSFGYTSTASYQFKYGQVENTTDTNNQPVNYTYDKFGRVQSVTGPYEVGKQPYTIRFEYHPEATIPWALTQHIDQYRPNDPLETVLFIDGLKRILQTKKDATVRPESGNTRDMMVVSGPVSYDFVGRAIKQFYPLTEPLGQAGKFNPGVDTIPPTVMTYDVLDRMLTTTLPDGTVTRTDYGFGPDRNGQVQFWTKVTDANGKTKESYADVNQSVTAVKEFNNAGQQVIWTSYEYDALNQIVKVLDDQNHLTTVGYDNLGRRTQLNNPDTGLTETVYDLASNVVQRITAHLRAQGKAIQHEYDYKRLTRITYPNFPGNNVSYTYGGPNAAFNQAGRVVKVDDQSGQEERFYGPLGEVVKSIKTIASDTGKQPEVYTTEYEYDTWNRLQKLTYPDGEVLTNQYDAGGLLQSVVGDKAGNHYKYVNRLEYDKFEQRALLEFGNGVRTNYQYAANNRRLVNLQAGKAGKLFQDLTYQYDLVGNILGQANLAKVTSPSQMGGATQYKYQYDDLYRLVHAEGTFNEAHKSHRYQLDMGYDTVHNILSKKQLAEVGEPSGIWLENKKVSYDWQYAYSGPQPHAPTHIGERTFNYDANGNQIGWSNDENGTRRNIVWDEENRIQTILENGHAMTYKYDAAGTRVIKRGPQGETAYVNQFFVIRNGAVATKQVYAGSSRVVSKLVKQESAMDKVAKTKRGERKNDGTQGNAGGSSCDNPGQGQSPHCSSTTPPAPVTPPGTPPVDPPITGGEGTAATVVPTPSTPVGGEGTPPPSTPVTPPPSGPGNSTASSKPDSSSSTGNGNGNASSGQTSSGNGNGGQPNTSTPPNTQPTPVAGKVKGPEEKDLYFYHPDHLGSTHYVTDAKGELYQHAEYFAFGESWVEQASSQRVAFGFTGKEFDEETGLYYFGARYYDARTSVWVSADPILGAYLGGKASMGGVYNSFNLGLYSYGHLNPVKFVDPNGNQTDEPDKPGKLYDSEIAAARGAFRYLKMDNVTTKAQRIEREYGGAIIKIGDGKWTFSEPIKARNGEENKIRLDDIKNSKMPVAGGTTTAIYHSHNGKSEYSDDPERYFKQNQLVNLVDQRVPKTLGGVAAVVNNFTNPSGQTTQSNGKITLLPAGENFSPDDLDLAKKHDLNMYVLTPSEAEKRYDCKGDEVGWPKVKK